MKLLTETSVKTRSLKIKTMSMISLLITTVSLTNGKTTVISLKSDPQDHHSASLKSKT